MGVSLPDIPSDMPYNMYNQKDREHKNHQSALGAYFYLSLYLTPATDRETKEAWYTDRDLRHVKMPEYLVCGAPYEALDGPRDSHLLL